MAKPLISGQQMIEECLKYCGKVDASLEDDRNAYLEAIIHNTANCPAAAWEKLSDDTQDWANDNMRRHNTNKKFPDRAPLRMIDPVTGEVVPEPKKEKAPKAEAEETPRKRSRVREVVEEEEQDQTAAEEEPEPKTAKVRAVEDEEEEDVDPREAAAPKPKAKEKPKAAPKRVKAEAEETDEDDEPKEKPKAAKKTKAKADKAPPTSAIVREMLIDNPSLTPEQVKTELEAMERTYSLNTINVIKYELGQTMDALRRKGLLK